MSRALAAVLSLTGLALAGLAGLQALRLSDRRQAERLWVKLANQTGPRERFSPEMVHGLPDPARRYFLRSIAPGTRLSMVAEILMIGVIGLGDKSHPGYQPMHAREILAPPHGFVWQPVIGAGLSTVTGSDAYADGEGWTRFWLSKSLPVARSASSPDYLRSAAARSILEALWVPAALLPRNGVTWEPIDHSQARAVFDHQGERFALTVTVAPDGLPLSCSMQRWTNANEDRVFRYQPTGGLVLETATIDGYTVPVRIDAGNHFDTDAYFPFFRAQVLSIRFR